MNQIERGIEPPAWFFEQPEIDPHLHFHWEAFGELSTERQIGMGIGPIPWSAIKAYAEEFGIVGDEFESFLHIMRAMDSEYLSQANSSHKLKDTAGGMTAPTDDVERSKAVLDVIKSRAASANKRQVKRKPH